MTGTTTTTTTVPLVKRTCGYLNTTYSPWVTPPADTTGEEKGQICTQEEWDKFVQEMGMEKEDYGKYYSSSITATGPSYTVSGAAW